MSDHHRTEDDDTTTALMLRTPTNLAGIGGRELRPFETRRVERLHERAPAIVKRARAAGVGITYLGLAPLFQEVRLYRGSDSDWILAPVDQHEHDVVPRRSLDELRRLHQAGLDFHLYAGHEVDPDKTCDFLADTDGQTVISRTDAVDLVGPVPEPAGALQLAEQLDRHSETILNGVRRGAPVVGAVLLGVLAAPFLVVGGALAAAVTIDPIIFGAIPALTPEDGEPAAFFELTRWEW